MTNDEIISNAMQRLERYNAQTMKLVVRDKEYSVEQVLRDQGLRYDAVSIFETEPVRWEIDSYNLGTNDKIFWVADAVALKLKMNFVSPDASTHSPSQRAFERNQKVQTKMQSIFQIIYETIKELDVYF